MCVVCVCGCVCADLPCDVCYTVRRLDVRSDEGGLGTTSVETIEDVFSTWEQLQRSRAGKQKTNHSKPCTRPLHIPFDVRVCVCVCMTLLLVCVRFYPSLLLCVCLCAVWTLNDSVFFVCCFRLPNFHPSLLPAASPLLLHQRAFRVLMCVLFSISFLFFFATAVYRADLLLQTLKMHSTAADGSTGPAL